MALNVIGGSDKEKKKKKKTVKDITTEARESFKEKIQSPFKKFHPREPTNEEIAKKIGVDLSKGMEGLDVQRGLTEEERVQLWGLGEKSPSGALELFE